MLCLIAAVIVPTYNEKENIATLLKKITSTKVSGVKFNVIVVDDSSPDGTAAIARRFKNVIVISRPAKLGLGTAYVAGFKKAFSLGADAIFTMDADLSHDFGVAPAFIEKIREGNDLVIGSRYIKGGGTNWGASRKIISGGANLLAGIILGVPAHDQTSGFRCYKASLLKSIHPELLKSSGYSFLEEMIYRCHKKGAKIAEVPIFFADRTQGKSKLGKKEIYKFPFILLKLRFGH